MGLVVIVGMAETPKGYKETECLALNIYHESRNESTAGKVGVAQTTLNRVKSRAFPDSVCEVVYQGMHRGGHPIRDGCQFSWYCDGMDDRPRNLEAYRESVYLAKAVMDNMESIPDITDGSLYYHADYVSPRWRLSRDRMVKIDSHIFYR